MLADDLRVSLCVSLSVSLSLCPLTSSLAHFCVYSWEAVKQGPFPAILVCGIAGSKRKAGTLLCEGNKPIWTERRGSMGQGFRPSLLLLSLYAHKVELQSVITKVDCGKNLIDWK